MISPQNCQIIHCDLYVDDADSPDGVSFNPCDYVICKGDPADESQFFDGGCFWGYKTPELAIMDVTGPVDPVESIKVYDCSFVYELDRLFTHFDDLTYDEITAIIEREKLTPFTFEEVFGNA